MNDKAKPNFTSAEYNQRKPQWTIVDDVVEGPLRLIDKAATYLPQFPKEPNDAYKIRKESAVLFTATEITLEGLVGLAFQKEPTLGKDVPDEIAAQLENADLKGNHWRIFAKNTFRDSVKQGNGWILTDMPPPLPPGSTAEDEKRANRRPYFVFYRRDQALNHRWRVLNGKQKLEQITFEECSYEADGEFGEVLVRRYRTFTLMGSFVEWKLRRLIQKGRSKEEFELENEGVIPFDEIPVAQVLDYEKPPLLDLAMFNLRHFRQLSDYDVGLHIGNQELLWVKGLVDDGILAIGHHFLFKLDETGAMGFASPTGACIDAARTNLEDAKKDMALMGLSFVAEQARVEKTATQSNIDNGQEQSKLATMVDGLRDALEQSLNFWARYLGLKVENKMSVELTPGEDITFSSDDIRIASDLALNNQITLETLWAILKNAGRLPKDFDATKERAALDAQKENDANLTGKMFDKFSQGVGAGA
jgi:hypothetical protein